MTNLKIELTQSQSEFLQLDCDYPLFVGGPGCGKSFLLGFMAVQDALHSPDAKIYIYAPENHHIRTIEVPNVMYWLEQLKIKHKGYNKHENCIITDDPRCGDFYFKNMETASTLVGYQSYRAHVDELDTLDEAKAADIWKAVIERNRQQPAGLSEDLKRFDPKKNKKFGVNKAYAYTTPEGYKFCYKVWDGSDNPKYKLVRGRTEDNPVFPSDYVDNVRDRYPPHVAERYLNGFFTNMDSLAVYYNYKPDRHISFETIKPGEPLYIGCDFNKNNTSATIYVIRNKDEWHAVGQYARLRDAADLAQRIDEEYQKKGHKIFMYPDATGANGNNANSVNLSAIQELEARGFTVYYNRKSKKNFLVTERVDATNRRFLEDKIFINRELCPDVHKCFINQPFGKDGKPCKKTGYDHQNDASTYPIVWEFGPKKKLFHVPIKWMR